jgi:hypothetical protein
MANGLGGNVYTGSGFQQGRGLATVLKDDWMEKMIAVSGAKSNAKAADRAKGAKATQDSRPEEVWNVFSNEFNKEVEGVINAGAYVQGQKGITNMWSSNDSDALAFRNQMGRLNQQASNINQYQEEWQDQIHKVTANPEEYTPESVNQVLAFADPRNYQAVRDGTAVMPLLQFKEPVTLHSSLMINGAKEYQQSLGDEALPPLFTTDPTTGTRILDTESVPESMKDFIATRFTFDSEQVNKDAAIQQYNKLAALSPDFHKKYTAMAQDMGYGKQGAWLAYQTEIFAGRMPGHTIDLSALIDKSLENAPEVIRGYEDVAGVTTLRETQGGPEFIEKEAQLVIGQNLNIVHDHAALAALGIQGSRNMTVADREKAAIQAYADQLESRFDEKFILSRDAGGKYGGHGAKEAATSYDKWREDMGNSSKQVAIHAANFIFGQKGASGEGALQGATVIDTPTPSGLKLPGQRTNTVRVFKLNYKDQKLADQARQEYLENLKDLGGTEGMEGPEAKAIRDFVDNLLKRSRGTTVMVPLLDQNEQVFKILHDKQLQKGSNLYERIEDKSQPEINPFGLKSFGSE